MVIIVGNKNCKLNSMKLYLTIFKLFLKLSK